MNKKMILVTHKDLGKTLIYTAESILGKVSSEVITSVSNEDLSLVDLISLIKNETEKDRDCFYILATDFPGGSCFIGSKKVSSANDNISTISGVNISMVLSFLTKKEKYNGIQLTEVIRTDGTRAIVS